MKKQKTIIISLGGAIICPKPGKIDEIFLKKFRSLILKFLKRGFRFVIIAGGGKTSRAYLKAANEISRLSREDSDWIGIYATRLNAQLVRAIFGRIAYPEVLENPYKEIKDGWKILIGAGWKPGCSTDYDSVLFAKRFGVKEIINASNTPYVYDRDFKKYKNAVPFEKISWKDYQKLVGNRWLPGLSTPFDPIAAKTARKLKIRILIIKGTDVSNFEKILSGKKFRGTVIHP
ncbi:MAG: UMP kinase [Patescibacteria group bacterium]